MIERQTEDITQWVKGHNDWTPNRGHCAIGQRSQWLTAKQRTLCNGSKVTMIECRTENIMQSYKGHYDWTPKRTLYNRSKVTMIVYNSLSGIRSVCSYITSVPVIAVMTRSSNQGSRVPWSRQVSTLRSWSFAGSGASPKERSWLIGLILRTRSWIGHAESDSTCVLKCELGSMSYRRCAKYLCRTLV